VVRASQLHAAGPKRVGGEITHAFFVLCRGISRILCLKSRSRLISEIQLLHKGAPVHERQRPRRLNLPWNSAGEPFSGSCFSPSPAYHVLNPYASPRVMKVAGHYLSLGGRLTESA
jgi:hypothetical protein